MRSRRLLVSQKPVERVVVEMMRSASQAAGGGEPLATLVEIARQHGLSMLPSGSPAIGGDETVLLGCLAAAQRKTGEHMGNVPREIRPLALDCAAWLEGQGLRLPFLAIQRLRFAPVRPAEAEAPVPLRGAG